MRSRRRPREANTERAMASDARDSKDRQTCESGLLHRPAALSPALEAAQIANVLVAHVLQGLARQCGAPARCAVHDHGLFAVERVVVIRAVWVSAELEHA